MFRALLLALLATRATAVPKPWARVREVLQLQPFIRDVAVVVGDGEGRLFHAEKGDMTLDRPLWVASSSKMVFVVRAMQLVEQGVLKLSDPVSKYLPYWTQDSSDTRSRVTLLHLLSFQSGYTFGLTKVDSCWLRPRFNFSTCVERLYHSLPHGAEPGTVWDYNEFHNQVVAAVLEMVTSTDIHTLLERDLQTWNMTHSRYANHEGPGGPDVSADLVTTASDYEQFMIRYFGGHLLSNQTVSVMEQDHMPERCSLESLPLVIPQGHYGIGNWWVCPADFDPLLHRTKLEPMPKRCVDAKVHSDQGLFGFWPVWDRRLGYWMLLAVEGLPLLSDFKTEMLQLALKPFIDRAVVEERGGQFGEVPMPDWASLAARADLRQAAANVSAVTLLV
mmetsp:Transcript_46033/g.107546  ORF Transcript_46033/g.107546 Transcript_46033/m.107546 type:complete len:390 (+) Transcript_46033:56-1225(+)